MAVESKPLFHPEVMRQQVRAFSLPAHVAACQPKLQHWADLIASGRADEFKETALLPDFLTDIFCGLLGYTGPAAEENAYTLSRERHLEVDGKFADAVLGRFQKEKEQFIAAVEGKGTRDPLERPFAGRRMSAVDQTYRYAINLPCDWIIVTSMRETRLLGYLCFGQVLITSCGANGFREVPPTGAPIPLYSTGLPPDPSTRYLARHQNGNSYGQYHNGGVSQGGRSTLFRMVQIPPSPPGSKARPKRQR
jgi:hypothetical protein